MGSHRKLEVFDHYRYSPRSVLRPGDRFRVGGGPIYVADDGAKVPMYERGVFTFRRHCVRGASRWLEAFRADGGGLAILWVGRPARSRTVPNLRRRPYTITRKLSDTIPTKRRRRGRPGRSRAVSSTITADPSTTPATSASCGPAGVGTFESIKR